jgi:hypothetical protein
VRLADLFAELAAGQPTLRERGLEHVDHPLAVGMRRSQVAAAVESCHLFVSRSYHHSASGGGGSTSA